MFYLKTTSGEGENYIFLMEKGCAWFNLAFDKNKINNDKKSNKVSQVEKHTPAEISHSVKLHANTWENLALSFNCIYLSYSMWSQKG